VCVCVYLRVCVCACMCLCVSVCVCPCVWNTVCVTRVYLPLSLFVLKSQFISMTISIVFSLRASFTFSPNFFPAWLFFCVFKYLSVEIKSVTISEYFNSQSYFTCAPILPHHFFANLFIYSCVYSKSMTISTVSLVTHMHPCCPFFFCEFIHLHI